MVEVRADIEDPERPTWAYDWPAGRRLAESLPEILDCRHLRLCDLGCGRGRLGLRALELGAAVVWFADGSAAALATVAERLRDGGLSEHARICQHRWGEPLPEPVDRILGGDILYRPECFADLLATIASSLSADGEALLADPRCQLEPELPGLAAAAGLRWHSERHADGFTLIRCRPGRPCPIHGRPVEPESR